MIGRNECKRGIAWHIGSLQLCKLAWFWNIQGARCKSYFWGYLVVIMFYDKHWFSIWLEWLVTIGDITVPHYIVLHLQKINLVNCSHSFHCLQVIWFFCQFWCGHIAHKLAQHLLFYLPIFFKKNTQCTCIDKIHSI